MSPRRNVLPRAGSRLTRRGALAGLSCAALFARRASADFPEVDQPREPAPGQGEDTLIPRTGPGVFEGPLFRSPTAHVPAIPTDEEIRAILADRIYTRGKGVGIVVGVIEPQRDGDTFYPGKRIIAEGTMGRHDPRPVDGNTIFEIGSISKVFTALLLADLAAAAGVSVHTPAEHFLPRARLPRRNGAAITLAHLASHRSGLPRMPGNFRPQNERNPYADYTVARAYQFLASHRLEWDIASRYVYSNFGTALLGHALAQLAGADYETLLRRRVFDPLGLGNSFFTLPWERTGDFALGHSDQLAPIPHWDFDFFAPAGGIRANAEDMLLFLAHQLGYFESALTPAIASLMTERWPASTPIATVGLGWHMVARPPFVPSITHDGQTGGFYSFAAYQPDSGRAVILLSNTGNRIDDIGWHLLDRRFRLAP